MLRNIQKTSVRVGILGALAALVACPMGNASARAAGLVGTVLYQLTPPPGFTAIDPSEQQGAAAGGEMVGYGITSGGNQYALLWNDSGTPIDLNPTNLSQITSSGVSATDGTYQVGNGSGPGIGNYNHALLWNGSPASAVDLNPTNIPNINISYANGVGGGQQVGAGERFYGYSTQQAMLWTGSAASAVDLNPTGANFMGIEGSEAFATDGVNQAGIAIFPDSNINDAFYPNHIYATLWSGTAASAINLNPAGAVNSVAYGVAGGQQVGQADPASPQQHAELWTGTAASAVDLTPTDLTGFIDSVAYGTNGIQQVGQANTTGVFSQPHAILWSGTGASAIDLQTLLPASGTWNDSSAYSIDAAGNIFGQAGGTYDGQTGEFAVEWSPVPEPATFTALAAGGALLLARRRRARRNA